jgi:hypothetical protein
MVNRNVTSPQQTCSPIEQFEKAFLNTEEVGGLIGRSPGAVRNLVLRRQIPFRKPGGRLMFLRREILEWIECAPGLSIGDLKQKG